MKLMFMGLCVFITTLGMCVYASEAPPSMTKKIVILLGPPGSGKGTQAVKLSKELNIPHISTGDLFRENLSKGTELGKKAKSYMEAGRLVPDEVVLDMLYDRVSRPDAANGYLLDGFPRTIPQAEAFDKHIGNEKLIVLNLEVNDDVIVKRIAGRLTCKECGKIFGADALENKTECKNCKGTLYQRTDDQPEVVKERLRVYHDQTEPLVKYYQSKNVLTNLDGEKSPDEVYKDLLAAYQSKLN